MDGSEKLNIRLDYRATQHLVIRSVADRFTDETFGDRLEETGISTVGANQKGCLFSISRRRMHTRDTGVMFPAQKGRQKKKMHVTIFFFFAFFSFLPIRAVGRKSNLYQCHIKTF